MTSRFDPCNAPRCVPWRTKVALFFDSSLHVVLGTLAFGMGVFFLFGLLSLNTFRSPFFDGPFLTSRGEIVSIEGSSFYEGRARPGNEIVEYRYQYRVGGELLKGVAYGHGRSTDLKVGTPLKIEYRIERPDWSRIDGWSALETPDESRFDHWSMATHLSMTKTRIEGLIGPTFFSLVGGVLLVVGVRRGFKNVNLVVNGIVVEGRVIQEVRSNPSTRVRPLSRALYTFRTLHGTELTTQVNTLFGSSPRACETLVYDHREPQKAIRLHSLSKSVQRALTQPVQVERADVEAECIGDPSPSDEIDEINEVEKTVNSRPIESVKKVSLSSVLVKCLVLSCIGAAGAFEFDFLSIHFPDEVVLIGVKQLLAGVCMLAVGGLLTSTPLLSEKPSTQSLTKKRLFVTAIAAIAWVTGLVLTVAAVAGLLYWGYLQFN